MIFMDGLSVYMGHWTIALYTFSPSIFFYMSC